METNNESQILVEEPDEKVNILFSASSLNNFLTCKFKYKVEDVLRLGVPIELKPPSLDTGGIAHIGLETYYRLLRDTKKAFPDRVHEAILEMQNAAADITKSNIDNEDFDNLVRTISQNLEFWRHEDEFLEILGVEEPFDYILHEDEWCRIVISGVIDLIVNKKAVPGYSGEYLGLPFDHKTYSRDFPVDRLDNQFMNYATAVQSNHIIVNRIGLQKTVKAEDKFKRLPLSYDPLILQEWRDNTVDIILTEYLSALTKDKWTRNFTNCRKFNKLCSLHDVCNSSGQETKDWKLSTNYVKREEHDKYKGRKTND